MSPTSRALEYVMGYPPETIADIARQVLEGALRQALVTLPSDAHTPDRAQLIRTLELLATHDLGAIGLKLTHLEIKELRAVTDPTGPSF